MPVAATRTMLSLARLIPTGGIAIVYMVLSACANHPDVHSVANLAPLEHGAEVLSPQSVPELVYTPDLLAIDEDMQAFVELYAPSHAAKRQRLRQLHRAVTGAGALNMEYDTFAEGTARETFHRGAANCLSYANLFVALAREAGLDARYQWLEVRPQWTRMGERVALRLHVNVAVHVRRKEKFMVDIDPLPSREIASSQEISDRDAQALYHNNIAMKALAREDTKEAWLHGVRALQLSPGIAHLWVNLGAIYRLAGQHQEAELNYLQALALDPTERSAMNNLVILYSLEERQEEMAYWEQKVDRYRENNPYYHAWQGDQAGEEGNWRRALAHYLDALELEPEDGTLLYGTGVIYQQLGQYKAATRYVEQAMGHAALRSDVEKYRFKLKEIDSARMAAM